MSTGVREGAKANWARLAVLSALYVVLSATPGCASSRPGFAAYDAGQYPEALAALEASEHHARSGPEEVRYELTRGLAHLAAGDRTRAEHWLLRAKLAVERKPDLLDRADRGRLAGAWQSLGLLPGEMPNHLRAQTLY